MALIHRGERAAARHGQRQLRVTLMAAAAGIHTLEISMERSVTEMEAAVDAFQGLPPSWEQANALITLYWLQWGSGRPAEGIRNLRLAVEIEEGLPNKRGRALATLAHAQLMDGQVEPGLAALAEARHRLGLAADGDVRLAMAEIDTNLKLNQLEEAANDGLAVWNRLRANGLADDYIASLLFSKVGEALRGLGQVDRLRQIVEPLTTDQAVNPATWLLHRERCWVDLCAGRLEAADDRLNQIMSRSRQLSFEENSELVQLRVEVALWRNDPRAAIDLALPTVQSTAGVPPHGWAARLLTSAMWACADLVEDAHARRSDANTHAGRQICKQLQAAHAALAQDPFAAHPFFVTATAEGGDWAAELHRCQGDTQPEVWLAAAQKWETFRRPHRAAYVLWRAAQALLNLGQREPAASALQQAHQHAHQHVPMTDAITQLARIARVSLEPPTTPPDLSNQMPAALPMFGLTSRELDVLRLLTEGHTNAEIGARLFMSPKTASVHITAILRKLQATNRVHAAAIAERLKLTDS